MNYDWKQPEYTKKQAADVHRPRPVAEEPLELRPLRVEDVSITMFDHTAPLDYYTDTDDSDSDNSVDGAAGLPGSSSLRPQSTPSSKSAAQPYPENIDARRQRFEPVALGAGHALQEPTRDYRTRRQDVSGYGAAHHGAAGGMHNV